MQGLGCRVWGLGVRVQGFRACRVSLAFGPTHYWQPQGIRISMSSYCTAVSEQALNPKP